VMLFPSREHFDFPFNPVQLANLEQDDIRLALTLRLTGLCCLRFFEFSSAILPRAHLCQPELCTHFR